MIWTMFVGALIGGAIGLFLGLILGVIASSTPAYHPPRKRVKSNAPTWKIDYRPTINKGQPR